jgi:hypothetical protein
MVDGPEPKNAKGYQTTGGPSWWGTNLDEHETTPELKWPKNIRVFDAMRGQDSQVQSVLNAVTMPIMRTEWFIEPNGARPEVVEHIADDLGLPIRGQEDRTVLRTRGRFDFSEYLQHALLKLVHGHSFFEQEYELVGRGAAQRAHLKKLLWLPPRTFSKISVARDGGLVSVTQEDSTPGADSPEIPVAHLVAHVNNREGGNWLGQSLLRTAYKNWMIKDRLLRVQAQTIDRNGMGVPVYTASQIPESIKEAVARRNWAQAEIDSGEKLARMFRSGETAGAAIPYGATMELIGVKGELPDASIAIKYHDDAIARAVLAHFLNLGGDQSTGSYALGDTFAEFFTLSLQTIAMGIQAVTQQHVVEDIVDINWGTSEPAPRIMFEEIGSRHPITAEAIRAMIESGAIRADDPLEAALRTIYKLPAADPTTAREYKAPGQTAKGGQEKAA